MRPIIKFFDHLEDHVRGYLSRYPLVYGLVAGVAVVLFWRGVWETSDLISLDPVASLLLGLGGLLATGVLVSSFIGTRLIITGLKGEKKMEEKTIEEIESEEQQLARIYSKLEDIETNLDQIKDRQN